VRPVKRQFENMKGPQMDENLFLRPFSGIIHSSENKGATTMAVPKCMLKGKELDDVREDFRTARRVEQYRLGEKALYFPEGLRWNYLPLTEIQKVEESFRVISAGHCVPVREKRPEIDICTEEGTVHMQLEKQESMKEILNAIGAVTKHG
jgi:hypothetical protein